MLKSNAILAGVTALGLATVWGAGAAQASTVNLEQTVQGTSTILNVFGENDADRLYDDARITVQGSNMHVYAGAFQVTEVGTANNWLAFCVDLFTSYAMPATFETNAGLFGTDTVTRLDKLFTNFFAGIDSDTKAAGFQVAIWEIVSDATLDLTTGDFSLQSHTGNAQIETQTASYLAGLDGLTGGDYVLTFLESNAVQNLVIGKRRPSSITPPAVPLPAGGILLLGGLGALGWAKRRKSQAA